MRRMGLPVLALGIAMSLPASALAQDTGVVAGEVIDQNLAITLPGVPVEVVGSEIAYTDLDGRFRFDLPAGQREMRIVMAGYAEQTVIVDVVEGQLSSVQVALASNVFAEELTVTAPTLDAVSSTAAAQLMMRMRAPGVQDNIGALEMSANNDSNAADAMQRVTGVSVVEGQSVFVRGLGERYSNTTLAGATLPTTEPDRRVVPLDLFPAGLIDSVQVSKTYTPDKPSQFAGGLVEIVPLKLPDSTSFEVSAGGGWNSLTTGTMGLGYGGGGSDWAGFDDGTRALPDGFPTRKVTRGGRFSGTLGFSREDLERLGEQFSNEWDPQSESLPLDQSYSVLFGGRFGKLGIVATLRHAQGSQYTEEEQTFYKVGGGGAIERFNGPYDFEITERSGTVGGVGNIAYRFTPNQQLSFDNFFTHVGTNETRRFQGYNDDAGNDIRNQRLWWVEEQITSHHLGGEHLFPTLSNSRFDWKIAFSNADRDEPDLREVLYESDPAREAFVLADESQSGLRQFNDLADDTIESNANWSTLFEQWGGFASQVKLGGSYIDRSRDFQSRRLRFVPRNLLSGHFSGARNLSPPPRLRGGRRPRRRPLAARGGALHGREHRRRVRAEGGDPRHRPLRRGAGGRVVLRDDRPSALGFDSPRDRRAYRAVPAGRRDARIRSPERLTSRRPTCGGRRSTRPTSSPPSTSCTRCGRTRTSGSATARRSTGRSSARSRRSSSPTWWAAGRSSGTPTSISR